MIRLLSVLFVMLLLTAAWPSAALGESLDEYEAALRAVVTEADAASSHLPADSSLADYRPLAIALDRLERIAGVSSSDGTTVAVDNTDPIRALRGTHAEGAAAVVSLRVLLDSLQAANDSGSWDGRDYRGRLDEVLARPEFQGEETSPIARWLADLRESIGRWLASVLPRIDLPPVPGVDLDGPARVAFWGLSALLIVFALGFVAFAIRSARHSLAGYADLRSPETSRQEDSRAAQVAAHEAAQRGEFRAAVHYTFLWGVLSLAERSSLHYDRSLTNREQLRQVSAGFEASDLLRGVVETFDRVWYGHGDCTQAEFEDFERSLRRAVETTT